MWLLSLVWTYFCRYSHIYIDILIAFVILGLFYSTYARLVINVKIYKISSNLYATLLPLFYIWKKMIVFVFWCDLIVICMEYNPMWHIDEKCVILATIWRNMYILNWGKIQAKTMITALEGRCTQEQNMPSASFPVGVLPLWTWCRI